MRARVSRRARLGRRCPRRPPRGIRRSVASGTPAVERRRLRQQRRDQGGREGAHGSVPSQMPSRSYGKRACTVNSSARARIQREAGRAGPRHHQPRDVLGDDRFRAARRGRTATASIDPRPCWPSTRARMRLVPKLTCATCVAMITNRAVDRVDDREVGGLLARAERERQPPARFQHRDLADPLAGAGEHEPAAVVRVRRVAETDHVQVIGILRNPPAAVVDEDLTVPGGDRHG